MEAAVEKRDRNMIKNKNHMLEERLMVTEGHKQAERGRKWRMQSAEEVWKWKDKRAKWEEGYKTIDVKRRDGGRMKRGALLQGRAMRCRRGPTEGHVLQIAFWEEPMGGGGLYNNYRAGPDCTQRETCSATSKHCIITRGSTRAHTHTRMNQVVAAKIKAQMHMWFDG